MSAVVTDGDIHKFFDGKHEVRHTIDPKTGRQMAHVYDFLGALGMKHSAAQMALRRFLNNEQIQLPKLRFPSKPGQKQNHPSWAADAPSLCNLALTLNPKFSNPFRNFVATCATAVAGGSRAIQDVTEEMQVAQQTLPTDHILRVMGREAEAKDRQIYKSSTRREHVTNPTKETLEVLIKRKMPDADSDVYTQVQHGISDAIFGQRPNEPSVEKAAQTAVKFAVEKMVEMMLQKPGNPYENTDGLTFVDDFTTKCEQIKSCCSMFHRGAQIEGVVQPMQIDN